MSPSLKKRIVVEIRQIHRLLEVHSGLLSKCKTATPGPDDLAALSAILHSFYTGLENIFKQISKEFDGITIQGPFWHSDLIESMTIRLPNRPPLLSSSLSESLQEYLDFRHVFRQAYSFELKWDKMAHLVLNLETVFKMFETECNTFISHGSADN